MKNLIVTLAILQLSLFAVAQPKGYKKTPSGLAYKFHKDVAGKLPNLNDILVINFVFKTPKDSVLRNTFTDKTPIEMPLQKPAFVGSLEEGLAMMSIGDSATFLINSDSLFTKLFNSPLPPFIASGSSVPFVIKMEKIFTPDEFKKEQDKKGAELKSKEDAEIQKYIKDNKLIATKTASGLYYVQKKVGTGVKAESGKKVSVHYTGKLLNGSKFDSSVDRGQPFEFGLGAGQVIKGWDEGIALMNVGDQGLLLIPSELGYGSRGAGGSIPPNSILIFEVELLDVK